MSKVTTMELKPCPFCGSSKVENWASRPPNKEQDIWCVFCRDCSCEGPEALTEAQAAAKWNSRLAGDVATALKDERERRHLEKELADWLNTQTVTSDNIGEIRRACFMPWDSKWNGIVRDETAAREGKPVTRAPVEAEPYNRIDGR